MEKNKMMVLYLMAVLAISACYAQGKSCSYRLTADSTINGGLLVPVTGLNPCMAYCTLSTDCQGFDINPDPDNNVCWWHKKQSGLQSNKGIQHYDKICQVTRDVVSSPGNPECFKTNYQGPVSDFWSAPNGVTWKYQIAHFGLDWPQTGVDRLPLSSFIDTVSFENSDNLDYFYVVVTENNGKTITTKAIGPNDHSTTFSGANNVKRVDFYLAPVDFQRKVSVNDIGIKACNGIKTLRDCAIFNILKDLILTSSLGIIRPGGTSGTFSASVAPENPFIELDLNCSGDGTVDFTEVNFPGARNFNSVVIGVWDGETPVPIANKDAVASDSFNDAQGINFGSSVRGNRIRATITPPAVPDQGISASLWFSRYSITVSEKIF